MRRAAILLALTTLPRTLAAQESPPIIAIRAGTLIDGTGAAPVKNAVILVQGDRITAVGAGVAVPNGATVIDLSGATVLPGFIDAHVHLVGRTIGDGDWQHARLTELPSELVLLGAAHAQQTLEAGFTTVRNVGAPHFGDLALRNAITAGWVPGPRIVGAGMLFGIQGGHCDATDGLVPGIYGHAAGVEEGVADGADAARSAVRYMVKYGADLIKICATGGVLSPTDSAGVQQYSEDEMRVIVETATLMKQHGTYLVPTLLAGYTAESLALAKKLPPAIAAKALAIAPRMRASFKLALDAGVKIALGTDAGVMRHGTNAREFELMVKYGMTPMRAIHAGTLSAATLLGKDAEVGSLERGKLADIVAVTGDPVQDIRTLQHVDFVMKGGAVVKQHGQVMGRSDAAIP